MWKRFMKAQEYRAYCMAIRQLRNQGNFKAANAIAAYKQTMYQ